MNDKIVLTDAELNEKLVFDDGRIAWLEAALHEYKLDRKVVQAELDRRKVEAFWRNHPGLRLEKGDKLVITQELKDYKQEQVRQSNIYRLGKIYEVDYVSPDDEDTPIRIETGVSSTSVSLDIARRMREAYLQQERPK